MNFYHRIIFILLHFLFILSCIVQLMNLQLLLCCPFLRASKISHWLSLPSCFHRFSLLIQTHLLRLLCKLLKFLKYVSLSEQSISEAQNLLWLRLRERPLFIEAGHISLSSSLSGLVEVYSFIILILWHLIINWFWFCLKTNRKTIWNWY